MNKKGTIKKPKKRLKLRVNVLAKILLTLLLIASFSYYIFNLKIKNIVIKGTTNIKDVEIIETANIKNYPSIYRLNLSKIKKSINNLPLVDSVKIKRNIFGKLTIEIQEEKILFFYKYNNKYITNKGNSISDENKYYGYPTLINFTPDTVFENFVKGLNKIDYNIIKMISEIEYTPYKASDGTIVDNNLFTLTMNDTNTVYIDTVNIKNLNKYPTIFASSNMDAERGVLYLDTINDDRIYFKSYKTIKEEKEQQAKKEEEEKEKKQDEGE